MKGLVQSSVCVVLLLPFLAFGQEFRVSDLEAGLDESVPVTVWLDTDDGVEEYAFDLCHDGDLLSIVADDVTFGLDGDAANFSFHAVEIVDSSWTAEAIVSTGSPELLGEELELYVATYETLELGSGTLEFCGTTFVASVVIDGETVFADTTDGTAAVNARILRGDVNSDGVVEPLMELMAYMCQWCGACGDDPPEPDCLEAWDFNDDGEFNPGLAPIELQRIVRWGVYGEEDPPAPGAYECGSERGELDMGCELLPPADCELPERTTNSDYEIRLEDATVAAGGVAEVSLYVTADLPVRGFQFRICFSDELESGEGDIVFGEDLDPDLVHREWFNVDDESWTVALLSSFSCGSGSVDPPFPAGEDLEYAEFFFQTDGADGTIPLEFCSGERNMDPRFMNNEAEIIVPVITNGSIEILEAASFLRGDVDDNGAAQGIPDGLFLLRWFYVDGPEPACEKAADVDDNGEIHGAVDAIALLSWAFGTGDPLPDPGTEECGTDATEDEVECAATSCP